MGEEVFFWIVAPMMVLASLSLLFARKAVHVAMGVIVVMVGLSGLYISLDAHFLAFVQIVVYTGAVMMLFVFVLMLVGVDQLESLKQKIRLQWLIGILGGTGLALILITTIGDMVIKPQSIDSLNNGGNSQAIATIIFRDWVPIMEVLGGLLVVAAVGALVLTHAPRLGPASDQRTRAAERVRGKLNPVNKPMPGVYARHNALDIPALDPLGNPIALSVSRVLDARHQAKEGEQWRAIEPEAGLKRKGGKS